VTSTMLNVKVNSRYHGIVDNPYALPNDEDEKARLDSLQYCLSNIVGGNIIVPINEKPTQIGIILSSVLTIVDIGTGSGAWVIEVADKHIKCRVIGTDLSPIQPKEVPENAEFFVADLVDGLDFDTGSTDLVNSRYSLI
jgi:tRNA G46 methylase TrmB